MMRIGSAADHGGFSLKGELAESCAAQDTTSGTLAPINWTRQMATRTSSSPLPEPSPRAKSSAVCRYAAAALAPPSLRARFPACVPVNWSNSMGLIAGVEVSVAGRNSASYIAPQIALTVSF
jgi:hypothetical protein